MKHLLSNSDYFVKEVKTIIGMNRLSGVLSVLSTALIFLLLALVVSGWRISSHVVDVIQKDAEINAYYRENMTAADMVRLADSIAMLDGVRSVHPVNEEQAYERMARILGKEAAVLAYFDENPFSPYIEINIHLEKMDAVVEKLQGIPGIEHVRDNRDILERIRTMAGVLRLLGYLMVAAVGISTLVIISHLIRSGIDSSREQIRTLRLLGAPESFIGFPFLLQGLLLSMAGGILAIILAAFLLSYIYAAVAGPLPFVPLPARESLVLNMALLIVIFSAFLGVAGSCFGLAGAKKNRP